MKKSPFTVVDGGLSTALEALGHRPSGLLWTAEMLLQHSADIVAAHRSFVEAGAEVIITSSYQASQRGFTQAGCSPSEARRLLASTTELARQSGALKVAASLSCYGAILGDGSEFNGCYDLPWSEVRRFHRERIEVLADTGPDLFAIETIPSGTEAEIILEELQACTSTPAWVSFTCQDHKRTWSGEALAQAVSRLNAAPLLAVGVNCTAPHLVSPLLESLASVSSIPLLAYPNRGGRWDSLQGWQGINPALDWPVLVPQWLARGASWIGGCCGVGPAEIAGLFQFRQLCCLDQGD